MQGAGYLAIWSDLAPDDETEKWGKVIRAANLKAD